jgi:hypothetical protein
VKKKKKKIVFRLEVNFFFFSLGFVVNEKKGKYKHSSLRSTMYPEIVMKCDSSFLGGKETMKNACYIIFFFLILRYFTI